MVPLSLMETEPRAKGSVPVGILLCSVMLSGRSSCYLQAELFVTIVMEVTESMSGIWTLASVLANRAM
jgi:hypothetical protein